MGALETLKGLFATKQNTTNTEVQPQTDTLKTYKVWGFEQAGKLSGVVEGLLPCLQNVYFNIKAKIEGNQEEQEKRKAEKREKINTLTADNETIAGKTKNEKENLIREEDKIEKLKGEIDYIKNHPETITEDSTTKLGFIIGLVIITFLTIYLFIFYSSASYSAFFKQFTLDSGIVDSIFDPQALQIAWQNGFTELILILTIPFVFLGLGYLIYKFGEQKGFSKYLKITGLVVVTFIFDSILAYEIVEKIYNIQKSNTFQTMPDMTISLAAQQVNFWLIIFAGFIVYIIWGFVFSFIMSEYAKLDKVNVAIELKNKKLEERKQECKNIKARIAELEKAQNDNNAKIKTLTEELNGNIIYIKDVEEEINNFFTGWLEYMDGAKKEKQKIDECVFIKNNFIMQLHNSAKIENN